MGDAGNVEDQISALASKHKQEKKELQGKALSMKKSISKTDKKKKKELNEQIEKLEQELQKRHDDEMAALKTSLPVEGPPAAAVETATAELDELAVSEPREPRVTKAQRRRDKKAEQQRQRQQLIAEQELLNLEGARHLETTALRRRLRARGRAIHEVPSDGDCLYAAVLHQLGDSAGDVSVAALRHRTADELRQREHEYRPFLTDPATGDMYSDEGYGRYCQQVAGTPAWGGQTEVAALSSALNRCIEVVQAEGPSVVQGAGRPGETLMLTYHRHMYGLGEHYNSTRTAAAEDDRDAD